MIYHVSIEADAPRQVATVLAEIIGGVAAPFPPVAEGSWIAMADDAHRTAIEVYPRGTRLRQGRGDADAIGVMELGSRRSATHVALGTARSVSEIEAIAAREGWPVRCCRRGGMFGVLELWVERCLMIELLTPEMQAEYLGTFTAAAWIGQLRAMGVRRAA